MGPTALLPLRRKWSSGFLSPLKIHRPRSGSNPRTLGPVASTLTTSPARATNYYIIVYNAYNISFTVGYEQINRRAEDIGIPFKDFSEPLALILLVTEWLGLFIPNPHDIWSCDASGFSSVYLPFDSRSGHRLDFGMAFLSPTQKIPAWYLEIVQDTFLLK
jgi:hypothetical protein